MLATKGYRALAASVVLLAVEDLDAAHRKVCIWREKERDLSLRRFVATTMGQQRGKRGEKHPLDAIQISPDEASAIDFFATNSKNRGLMLAMVDMDTVELPKSITDKLDFLAAHRGRLTARIKTYRALATKAEKTENL